MLNKIHVDPGVKKSLLLLILVSATCTTVSWEYRAIQEEIFKISKAIRLQTHYLLANTTQSQDQSVFVLFLT